MVATTFQFDRDFQVGILGLMTQSWDFLVTALELVQPQYFEDRVLVWTFTTMRDYYIDHKMRADVMVLENELRKANQAGRVKDEDMAAHREVIMRLAHPVDAQHYVVNEVVRFCRKQEVRKAMLDLAPKMETDDDAIWDEIITRMTKSCTVGAHTMDLGHQYFMQTKERLKRRHDEEDLIAIPTGISELDMQIGGGLRPGQLGIWLGGTGVGKSIALPHCGKAAVVRRKKVAHYTLELNEDDIATRYDAAWTHVPVHELRAMAGRVEQVLDGLYARYDNSLIIKDYPTGHASVSTIKAHLQGLRIDGFVPDLVIVDYCDLMKPSVSFQNTYEDLGVIVTDLRGLAGELKIPIWTATQTNRAGYSQEVVDVDSIGDSYKKAQIADVVIAMCASKEEMEMDAMRLFVAKNRNGPSKRTVKIRTAYDRMCLWNPLGTPYQGSSTPRNPSGLQPPPGLPPKTTGRQPRGKV